jgi:probable addiction module antidote protein
MTDRSSSYKEALYQDLQDDEEALMYLQTALEDSREAFLVALRNVADARQFAKVARDSELDRVNLYRMLSENGNPTLSSLEKVLHALGLRLSIELESTSLVSAK